MMVANQKIPGMDGAQEAPTPIVLPGKLFRPALRPELVARPRLLRRLQDGWQRNRALTLVAAPAGYGKSTLVAAWAQDIAQEPGAAVAWLTLDAHDNDPSRFFTYLAAALVPAVPGVQEAVQHLFQTLPSPAPQLLMTTLLGELPAALEHGDGASSRLMLVLDDLQHLRAPALHETLALLVENRPPTLHLALVTREDPPLPLSRWRVRDLVTEIRARDLRFTEEESAQFLQHRSGRRLALQSVAVLAQRTEGWAAGLQLAALALRGDRQVDAFVQAFSGSHRYVIDYLVEEVLAQLPTDVRDFLHGTAVLERLCAPLCAAVLGQDGGATAAAQAMLEHLEEANLFLLPLDERRRWYRYHPLFADCLRAELDPAERATGHRHAAAWFAAEERYGQAISHAAAAGDTAEMARLVRLAAGPTFQKGDVARLASWMAQLPQERLLEDPELAIFHLLSLILSGRSQEAPEIIQLLAGPSRDWQDKRQRARLLAIKAWMADITDSPERATLAQDAAAALGKDDPFFSAFIAVPLGHAYLFQDRLSEAVATFREGLALAQMRGAAFARLSLLGNLVHALNLQGQRREALAVCQEAIEAFVDRRGAPLPSAGIPILLRGWLGYQANDLDQARADARQASRLLQMAFQDTMLTPLEVELPAMLYETSGEPQQALEAAREGRRRAARQQYGQAIRAAARLEADLLLRHGQLEPVRRWAQNLPAPRVAKGEPVYDLAHLTHTRLLLAEGRREEARQILSSLETSARTGQRGSSLISILLLQAIAGDDPQAALLEAVQRAAAEGYVRPILDECAFAAHGPQLAALLRPLLQRDDLRREAPAFADALLAALPAEEDAPHAKALQAVNEAALAEPLTEQELVVLQLLVAGHSNRDIAEELVITVGTAKWHVHNIYGKLGVSNRVDAILRAQALGLA